MTDEFLVRLDEEFPSDEKYAVKLIETQVLSQGYREKIELLIDKVDKMVAAANIDVLHEIKDVLSGMLDSLNSINKKYAFVSELVMKLDDKIDARLVEAQPDLAVANSVAEVNDRLRVLSEGLASLLADIQTSVSELERKYHVFEESKVVDADRLQEVHLELDSKLDELKAKQDAMHESLEEKLGELSLGISDTGSIHDKLDMLQINHAQMSSALDSASETVGELKSDIAPIKSRQDGISEALVRLDGRADELLEKLQEKTSLVGSELDKIDEKINSISVGTAESIDKFDEKLNQIYMSYSETAHDLEDKVNGLAEKISALARIEEKLSDMPDGDSMERLVKNQAAVMEDLRAKMEEKTGEMSVASAEAAAKIGEKLSDIYASSSHNLEKLESKVGEMSVSIAEVAAKFDAPVEIEVLKKENERLAKSMQTLQDDIDGMKSQMKAYYEEILAALAKPAARKRKKARRIRRVRRRRVRRVGVARPRKRRKAIEDEALDILIVNELNRVSMNIGSLKKATNVNENRLRGRLEVLMARGVVVRERRGRAIFYVSRAEQPMPTG